MQSAVDSSSITLVSALVEAGCNVDMSELASCVPALLDITSQRLFVTRDNERYIEVYEGDRRH